MAHFTLPLSVPLSFSDRVSNTTKDIVILASVDVIPAGVIASVAIRPTLRSSGDRDVCILVFVEELSELQSLKVRFL
jgi:hypothetical protein